MRALSLLACLAAALPLAASAQAPFLDLSAGLRKQEGRASLSTAWTFSIGPISAGAGPRLTTYQGSPRTFTRRGGDASLPQTVRLDPAVTGLNLMVTGELRLLPMLTAGANLDLAGIALGPERAVAGDRFHPSHGSLFLYGHKDRGSLNSEFYLRLRLGDRWAVRGGLSHYVVGYTGTAGGATARYDRFHSVPFLGFGYRFGR